MNFLSQTTVEVGKQEDIYFSTYPAGRNIYNYV